MSIIHTDIKVVRDIYDYLEGLDCEANTLQSSTEYAKEAECMELFAQELKVFGDGCDQFEFKSKEDFSPAFANFMFELVAYAKKRAAEYRKYSEQLAEEEEQSKRDAQTYGTYEQQVRREWHLQAGI